MPLKQEITIDLINEVHQNLWEDALSVHGDKFKVPYDELSRINETVRGLYVLQRWQNDGASGNPAKFLSSYSVYHDILIDLVRNHCSMEIDSVTDVAKTEKRADKYDAFLEWAQDHIFEQFTTEQLVEVAGFSYPTTLKFITESQTFRKVKKGLWEIRDEKADRKAEKNL